MADQALKKRLGKQRMAEPQSKEIAQTAGPSALLARRPIFSLCYWLPSPSQVKTTNRLFPEQSPPTVDGAERP